MASPRVSEFTVTSGSNVTGSQCIPQGSVTGVHVLFTITALLATLYLNFRKERNMKKRRMYVLHDLRHLVSMAGLFASVLWIMSTVLVDYYTSAVNYCAYAVAVATFVAVLCSLIFYETVESQDVPQWLFLLVAYWTAAIVGQGAILAYFHKAVSNGTYMYVGTLHMVAEWLILTFFVVLLLIELYLVKDQVRCLSAFFLHCI